VCVQITIRVKSIIRLNLQVPRPLAQQNRILDDRIPLARPRTPVGIAITIVITEQILAAGFGAGAGLKRDVDACKQVVGDFLREEGLQEAEVCGDFGGGQAAEEVERRFVGVCWHCVGELGPGRVLLPGSFLAEGVGLWLGWDLLFRAVYLNK
jgi:hypothetical protein